MLGIDGSCGCCRQWQSKFLLVCWVQPRHPLVEVVVLGVIDSAEHVYLHALEVMIPACTGVQPQYNGAQIICSGSRSECDEQCSSPIRAGHTHDQCSESDSLPASLTAPRLIRAPRGPRKQARLQAQAITFHSLPALRPCCVVHADIRCAMRAMGHLELCLQWLRSRWWDTNTTGYGLLKLLLFMTFRRQDNPLGIPVFWMAHVPAAVDSVQPGGRSTYSKRGDMQGTTTATVKHAHFGCRA